MDEDSVFLHSARRQAQHSTCISLIEAYSTAAAHFINGDPETGGDSASRVCAPPTFSSCHSAVRQFSIPSATYEPACPALGNGVRRKCKWKGNGRAAGSGGNCATKECRDPVPRRRVETYLPFRMSSTGDFRPCSRTARIPESVEDARYRLQITQQRIGPDRPRSSLPDNQAFSLRGDQ